MNINNYRNRRYLIESLVCIKTRGTADFILIFDNSIKYIYYLHFAPEENEAHK